MIDNPLSDHPSMSPPDPSPAELRAEERAELQANVDHLRRNVVRTQEVLAGWNEALDKAECKLEDFDAEESERIERERDNEIESQLDRQ